MSGEAEDVVKVLAGGALPVRGDLCCDEHEFWVTTGPGGGQAKPPDGRLGWYLIAALPGFFSGTQYVTRSDGTQKQVQQYSSHIELIWARRKTP